MSDRAGILIEQERGLRLVFFLNLAGTVPFILIAVFSGSMVLWTEALDYVRAMVVNWVSWQILLGISRNKFSGYDYGTDKMQSLTGIAGSLLYVATLIALGAGCVNRIFHPVELHAELSLAGVGLQVISGASDTWLWFRNRRLAAKLFSPVLEMQWRGDRASALVSFAMATGLVLSVLLRGHGWSVFIDPVFALALIGYSAVSFLPAIMSDLETLADKSLKEELQLRIDRRLAENFRGYSGFHGVRSRRSGGRIFIEIALSFPEDAPIREVMKTVAALRAGIEADIPGSEVSVSLQNDSPPKI
jgi:divalent metal cation (Fe/Co/Zn/Cd) transporter